MKTILLPTDFKKHSETALQFAIKIAQQTGAKIIVTHAYLIPSIDTPIPTYVTSNILEEQQAIVENELRYYEENISTNSYINGDPIQSESLAERDLPASEIVHLIKDKNIDLVVMGLEDENHLFQFLASTAIQVLNNIHCPLLLVHEQSKVTDFKNICFALENIQEDLPKIGQLLPLANVFNADVTLFHIDKSPEGIDDLTNLWEQRRHHEFLLNEIKQQYNYPNISFRYNLSDEIFDNMDEVVQQSHPDLLALVHKKRNWVQLVFHKSVVRHMIKNINTPLFIIH
ncbi:MAG: universal stress protein UspA [Chitinophagaceae bacterium]|nr:universal stress protein UspA [Chitinophagaceae bacterium]